MVEFGTGYFSAMDREYGVDTSPRESSGESGGGHEGHHHTNDVGVSAGDFGQSFGLGPVPNIPAVIGKLRAGGKTVELGFMGMGKGGGQGHTAGMYGKKQRQALRETARANRLDFTTHTSVGVFGLAGQDRQGNFSRQAKEASMQEIRRAIEFASDVGEGGPVVVHTGEFQRPISEAKWNKDGKFESFADEEKRASFYVIDSRTGQALIAAEKGRSVARPKWKKFQEGDEFWGQKDGRSYIDDNGQRVNPGDYIDYWGNKVGRVERVPYYNWDKGEFEIQQLGWEELEDEAKVLTKEAKDFWNKNKSNPNAWKDAPSYMHRFRDLRSEEEIKVLPEEAYVISTLETNAANSRGFALMYMRGFEESVQRLKKLKDAKKIYERIEETTDEEEKWRLQKQVSSMRGMEDLIPPETKYPSEIIDQAIKDTEYEISRSKESVAGQLAQAEDTNERIKYVESSQTYALKESYDSYARAGIYAVDKSDELRKQGRLKRDIMVAMENLFPESYGAHPDEIMKVVEGSRKKMVELLVRDKGYSESEARKKAEKTLAITFDTGHMNMWRKYWKGDPKKTTAQNDADYDKWMVNQVEKMAKKKIIGHVHLDDNYGYQDEHLAPGEGNAPIKKMVEVLKKNGYGGNLIVEPGADFTTDLGGFHSVMKTWKLFGSPVYGTTGFGGGPGPKSWGGIHYSHFGQNQPPYFTFQPYSPSEDWTLWSGVPLE